MISVCKTYTFSAGHHLPKHRGKCANEHGHNYRVEVEVAREGGGIIVDADQSSDGMVLDFDDLDLAVSGLVQDLDHTVLNTVFAESFAGYLPPTAENLARLFAVFVADNLPGGVIMQRVRVWETDKCWAEWRVK